MKPEHWHWIGTHSDRTSVFIDENTNDVVWAEDTHGPEVPRILRREPYDKAVWAAKGLLRYNAVRLGNKVHDLEREVERLKALYEPTGSPYR